MFARKRIRFAVRCRGNKVKSLGITIEARFVAVPALPGDSFLLYQAVRNLLENAIEFSPAGDKVQVEVRRLGNAIELEVSDRGPGIPDYAKIKVFDRFYSLPRSNGKRGTGLGLSFVKEIMALHGGSVELENGQDGIGCRARLSLRIDRN